MKNLSLIFILLLLSEASFSQSFSANWPNTDWSVLGTFNNNYAVSPDTADYFFYSDDLAGNGTESSIIWAESPVMDLTNATDPAQISAMYALSVNQINGDYMVLEYWDEDASLWAFWSDIEPNGEAAFFTACNYPSLFQSAYLDVPSFTTNQKENFRYRFRYNDNGGWGWGFCLASPTLTLAPAPPAPECAINPSPENGATINPSQITLSWEPSLAGGAPTSYKVYMGLSENNLQFISEVTESSLFFYGESGQTRYWQVQPKNGPLVAEGCPVWSFNVEALTPPANDLITGAIPITPSPAGTGCDNYTFMAMTAYDGTTQSDLNGCSTMLGSGRDRFYSWTASSNSLVWIPYGEHSGLVVRHPDGSIIKCTDLFSVSDTLGGWTIGDELILQVYSYGLLSIDVPFCLEENNLNDCIAPSFVSTTNINQTSVDIYWDSESADVTWEVAVVLAGAGVPSSGISTSASPISITDLMLDTEYAVYVRSSCGTGFSDWTDPVYFTTNPSPPANDECGDAILIPVNSTCEFIEGTITSATNSGMALPSCGPGESPNNDVWYQFVAPENDVEIKLIDNFSQGSLALYSGSCDELTLVDCESNSVLCMLHPTDLVAGETYYIGVYSLNQWPSMDGDFNLCVKEILCPAIAIEDINITSNSVEISWESNASSWEVQFYPVGESPSDIVTVTSPYYSFDGLTSGTLYSCKIRANCGDAYSDWILIPISTLFFSPAYLDAFAQLMTAENSPFGNGLIGADWNHAKASSGLSVKPNPVEDNLIVLIESSIDGQADIQIINAQGMQIQTKNRYLEKGKNSFEFDVSSLPSGVYFLSLVTSNGQEVVRFVVK